MRRALYNFCIYTLPYGAIGKESLQEVQAEQR